jgi:hypothetical protein
VLYWYARELFLLPEVKSAMVSNILYEIFSYVSSVETAHEPNLLANDAGHVNIGSKTPDLAIDCFTQTS